MIATSQFTISVINDGQDGAPGSQGPQGVSVEKVVSEYRLSDSNTSMTGSGTGYTWSETRPDVPAGKYLWVRERTDLSNNTSAYSDAHCDIVISDLVFNVDKNAQAITTKVSQSDVSTAISNYDTSTVSQIRDRVTETETDISGINTTISSIQTTVNTKADSSTVSTMQTQVNNISDTVSGHTQSISSITTRLDDDEEILETTETLASQTADKFTWLVSNGTSSSNFTLTSRVAELVSPQVVIKDPAGSATIITGGKIVANSITTAMLAADAIKSTNYEPSQYENSPYSESGTYLNLTTGNIITPNFGLDAANSTAYIDGSISARKLYLGMYPSYLSEDDGTLTSVNGALVTIETQSNNYMMFDGEILIINTDNFSIDEDGDVSMTGSVTATSGFFGGWQIYDDNIHYGSSIGSANSVFMIPAGSISSHVIGGSSAISGWVFTVGQNFGVTSSGSLYANGATITGNVTITGGEMGGLTVDTDSIYMSDTGISSNSSYYAIWAGETNGENGSSLTDAPFKVNHSGAMYAASGEIGGWQINNTSIIKNYTYDSKTGYTYMNSNPYTSGNTLPWNPMFGVYYDGAWQFYVRSNGELYSNNIKAIQGTLGSWTLSSTSIRATGNSKTTGIQVPSNGTWSFAAGATNANDWSTAPFRVNHNGAMYSTSGQIGSWNISANYLSYGTIAAANSIYLIPAGSTSNYTIGGSSAISGWVITAGANFGVTKTGVLYAKDAILSGKITSTDGTIGGFTINSNSLSITKSGVSFYIYSDVVSSQISMVKPSEGVSTIMGLGTFSVRIPTCYSELGPDFLYINASGCPEVRFGAFDGCMGVYDHTSDVWALKYNIAKVWLCANGYSVRMGEGNASNLVTFMPRTDADAVSNGKVNLGAASCRWQKVYTTSGVDTSSDERIKTIHRYLEEDHKKLFMALKPIEYSFIDKPDEKHFGLGAQTTEAAMEKYGFGPEYSLVEHAFYDEEDTYGRYDTYNMNYDEVAMLAVPVVQEHEKEIAMLKVRINELETRLSQLTH